MFADEFIFVFGHLAARTHSHLRFKLGDSLVTALHKTIVSHVPFELTSETYHIVLYFSFSTVTKHVYYYCIEIEAVAKFTYIHTNGMYWSRLYDIRKWLYAEKCSYNTLAMNEWC